MADFGRTISTECFDALKQLAEEPGENWWKDLLKLWRPSGSTAGTSGLRLAVRRNTLNFYLRGQSVARVGFTPYHEPCVSTHVKYAFEGDSGTGYAKMRNGAGVRHPVTGENLTYEGAATLSTWIERAGTYTGDEKNCVDQLVADDSSIIDLEMGLPKIARRMDCVALERDGAVIRIVFWEAKMINDSRLRSRSEPEVIDQLRIYKEFLEEKGQPQLVETAYRTTCELLIAFHEMAAQFSDQGPLDPLIVAAAQKDSVLKVDPAPRLVIFDAEPDKKNGNWEFHRKRLEAEKIHCRVVSDRPYRLLNLEGTI